MNLPQQYRFTDLLYVNPALFMAPKVHAYTFIYSDLPANIASSHHPEHLFQNFLSQAIIKAEVFSLGVFSIKYRNSVLSYLSPQIGIT